MHVHNLLMYMYVLGPSMSQSQYVQVRCELSKGKCLFWAAEEIKKQLYCFQFLLVMSGWTCVYFLSHHAAFEAFSGPKDVYEQEFFTENRVVHLRTLDSGLLTSLGEQEWHGHGTVCIAL